ncbi:RraA family protein [Gellertiella hungarica]|uniref:Regulator of RNase E activity RraA n=1 Tax=Gellertiella hungarica TaxID=1572859 RepID=A0A7W6NLA1_9HYPH|nr:RraA family protein [Gellertiella hungarica]MBB4066335.1 regulator of RNase E activity RraA [Gellertiella hungarica]
MEDIDDIWKSVTSASVCDALGRICNHRAHVLDLVSPTPGKVLFGPAVTMRMLPLRDDLFDENVNSFSRLFYEAVGATPKGKVLVLDSSGHSDVSVGGGTKLSRLHNLELAGMITDGRLRDFEELATYEPVFYCRGTTLRAGTGDLMPVAVNEPVNLAGVTVVPGDYVFADGAGTVILPAGLARQALKAAQEVQAQDSYYLDVIRGELPASDRGSASDKA